MLCSGGVCLVVVASSGSWFAAQYFIVWSRSGPCLPASGLMPLIVKGGESLGLGGSLRSFEGRGSWKSRHGDWVAKGVWGGLGLGVRGGRGYFVLLDA